MRIFICSVASIMTMLVLKGVASEQAMSNAETRLKQTVISLTITEQYPFRDLLMFLSAKAKCDLSFEIKDEQEQARHSVLSPIKQDLDVKVGRVNNRLFVTHMAVTNVSDHELLNALISKAGMTWRLGGAGGVVVMTDRRACLELEANMGEPMVCKTVDWGAKLSLLTNGMTRAEVEMIVPPVGGSVLVARSVNEYKITYNIDDKTAISLGYDYTGIEDEVRNKEFHRWGSSKNSACRLRNVYGVMIKEKLKKEELIDWFEGGIVAEQGQTNSP